MAAFLGLAAASRATGQLQCGSVCASNEFYRNCEESEGGFRACLDYYGNYVGGNDDVMLFTYTCCHDADTMAPYTFNNCNSTAQDPSCDHGGNPCGPACDNCECFSWGCDSGCNFSPILIDLENQGYQLTGLTDPVQFDLNADGAMDIVGWTAGDTKEAFLWLDRNGNGIVDNGAELFGNYTTLAGGGIAHNGFRALAEFDLPEYGGNADGVIDAQDAVFQRLKLWVDKNHNGISEPNEIVSLAQAGVVRIELKYEQNGRRDQFGNGFKYKGKAWIANQQGQARAVAIYDVFFVHQP